MRRGVDVFTVGVLKIFYYWTNGYQIIYCLGTSVTKYKWIKYLSAILSRKPTVSEESERSNEKYQNCSPKIINLFRTVCIGRRAGGMCVDARGLQNLCPLCQNVGDQKQTAHRVGLLECSSEEPGAAVTSTLG